MGMTRTPYGPGRDVNDARVAPGWDAIAHGEVNRAMATLVSQGVPMGQALGQVAQVMGEPEARPAFEAFLNHTRKGGDVLAALRDVAKTDPAVANAWLNLGLTSGKISPWVADGFQGIHLKGCEWVTSLPANLAVDGGLDLAGCRNLQALPGPIQATFLRLHGCASLESLPQMMDMGKGWVQLTGCPAWDGKIPDAVRAAMVFTDGHPEGVMLATWHKVHPEGEDRS